MSRNRHTSLGSDGVRAAACVALVLCIVPLVAWDDQKTGSERAAASDDVVTKLDRIHKLWATAEADTSKEKTQLYFQEIASLILDARDDPVAFVRQIVDYEVDAVKARDERRAWVAVIALSYARVSNGQILEAILPYLGRPDEATRDVVQELLRHIEDSHGRDCQDYSYYRSHIEARLRTNNAPNVHLVRHMFQRSPGEALQSYAMVVYQDERRKPFLWARHVVDDALWKRRHGFAPPKAPDAVVTEQLAKMAGRDEFWARLYAAEIIRRHPEFGTDELAARLAEDSLPLVAKTAKSVRESAHVRDK